MMKNCLYNRREFLRLAGLSIGASAVAFPLCVKAEGGKPSVVKAGQDEKTGRPNIVLIMADDFGYECVTANGGQSYNTPNLDRLAASGVRFEKCYVQPLCTPTRVQLMTGRYNIRNYVN